ncbi:hypothetical protein ACS0TY_022839 [Phlomoides rotata]
MTGFLNEVDDNSICKPSDDGKKSSSKGKKRKSGDADLSTLVDSLGEFMKFSKEAMMRDTMNTTKPKAQHGDGSKNVKFKLIESLKGINGLKVMDKLKVCDKMVQNPLRSICSLVFRLMNRNNTSGCFWMEVSNRKMCMFF